MGLSGSRGEKVAPASVTEGDLSAQTLKCQTASLSVCQKTTRLSNRQVADERNLAVEVDRMLDACENSEDTKNWDFQKMSLYMCENYTLCSNQTDQRDTDAENTHTIPLADLFKPSGFEDKKDICIFNKLNKPIKKTAVTALRAASLCTKTPHVPGICDDISLALPVSYDASEEDLMSEIEKEFG